MNTLNKTPFDRAPEMLCCRPRGQVMDSLFPTLFQLALICIVVIVVIPRSAEAAAGRIFAGADGGAGSHVKAFTSRSLSNAASFFAYPAAFNGGVRVAAGDVNGDGAADIITGSGPGAAHVKVFSGRDQIEIYSFLPYSGFSGGVFVAAGDVNGDGLDDIVTGTDEGAAHVKVFDGRTGQLLSSFLPYPSFSGGVRIAVGDVNGDGTADIITGTGAGAPGGHVKVFNGKDGALLHSFFAYETEFTGGVFVAAGDVNGDGFVDILTGAGQGAPGGHVKVFDGRSGSGLHSFFAYATEFAGGVRVAAGDVDGDGRAEILTAPGSGATPQVRVFDGLNLKETASFLAYPSNFTDGVFIGAASVKGPRLEIQAYRDNQIQLQWPSGCQCELEGNSDATDPRGWSVMDVRPVENGNRIGLLLPAVQKYQFYRLNCDIEAVR